MLGTRKIGKTVFDLWVGDPKHFFCDALFFINQGSSRTLTAEQFDTALVLEESQLENLQAHKGLESCEHIGLVFPHEQDLSPSTWFPVLAEYAKNDSENYFARITSITTDLESYDVLLKNLLSL